jgi:PIN domain nuclease of toxin-antitoxin system
MKYVLDTSAALKWVLPELGSDKALAIPFITAVASI